MCKINKLILAVVWTFIGMLGLGLVAAVGIVTVLGLIMGILGCSVAHALYYFMGLCILVLAGGVGRAIYLELD